jgi:uncharacterized protein YutE (UPF0331/DUF86 family)
MDKSVLANKLESLRRCVNRISTKIPPTVEALMEDHDLQDVIVLNLERAVQICVDISLHVISDLDIPTPETMADAFSALSKQNILDAETAQRMIKAVGFRNIAVHAYQDLDWRIVYSIATERGEDFRSFARQIAARL